MSTDPTMRPVRRPPMNVNTKRYVEVPPISADDAEAEPAAERLVFSEQRIGVGTAAAEPPTKRAVVLSYEVIYRGRKIVINAEGMSLDAFCDMLDARLGRAE